MVLGEEIQRHLPETLHVETTALGGGDLLHPIPWDISIRSDKEEQSIHRPSLAPMEETVDVPGIFGGTETVEITALGRSKAAHEFLALHYFGLERQALGCTLVWRPASGSVPGCLSRWGYCSGNVWSLAHCTVPPQNAPRIVDRLNEFGFPRQTGIWPAHWPFRLEVLLVLAP